MGGYNLTYTQALRRPELYLLQQLLENEQALAAVHSPAAINKGKREREKVAAGECTVLSPAAHSFSCSRSLPKFTKVCSRICMIIASRNKQSCCIFQSNCSPCTLQTLIKICFSLLFLHVLQDCMKKNEAKGHFLGLFPNPGRHKLAGLAP